MTRLITLSPSNRYHPSTHTSLILVSESKSKLALGGQWIEISVLNIGQVLFITQLARHASTFLTHSVRQRVSNSVFDLHLGVDNGH